MVALQRLGTIKVSVGHASACVALEAIKGIKTVEHIGRVFDIHPVSVSEWKTATLKRAARVFCTGRGWAEAEVPPP